MELPLHMLPLGCCVDLCLTCLLIVMLMAAIAGESKGPVILAGMLVGGATCCRRAQEGDSGLALLQQYPKITTQQTIGVASTLQSCLWRQCRCTSGSSRCTWQATPIRRCWVQRWMLINGVMTRAVVTHNCYTNPFWDICA
jgi:hypothetical protein